MAAAMMMPRPSDTSPISVARAVFCRSQISRHSSNGVRRSRMKKETANTAMPIRANTRAATMFESRSGIGHFPPG
jgi:hypothetical protein